MTMQPEMLSNRMSADRKLRRIIQQQNKFPLSQKEEHLQKPRAVLVSSNSPASTEKHK